MADIRTLTVDGTTYNIKDATARADIATLQTNVTTLQTNVTTLQTNVTTLQTNVTTLQTNVTTLQENTADLPQIRENVENNSDDISDLKSAIAKNQIYDTASGAIASFPDGADNLPVKKLVANIEPVQDLHGYDSPWPGGSGKNLLGFKIPNGSSIVSGVTITQNNDGSITLNGTSNAQFAWNQIRGAETFAPQKLTAGKKYTLSGSANKPQSQTYIQLIYKDDVTEETVSIVSQNATPASVTPTNNCTFAGSYCQIVSGVSFSNEILRPQFEIGSATDYAPYENICPITGFDSVKVTRTGKNLFNILAVGAEPDFVYRATNIIKETNRLQYNATDTWAVIRLYRKLPAGSYVFSAKTKASDGGYVATQVYINGSAASNVFTLQKETVVEFRFIGTNQIAATRTVEFYDIQLELGSSATAYEPYQGQTYDITLPTEAGTVYGGTLTVHNDGTGELVVDRASVTFPNNHSFILHTNQDKRRFEFSTSEYGLIKNELNSKSSHFKLGRQSYASFGYFYLARGTDITYYTFYDGDSRFATASEFEAWLQDQATNGTPVQVTFELATPITYTLTAAQVTTLLGLNNIFADSGDVDVSYRADTKIYIDSKIAEAIAAALNV